MSWGHGAKPANLQFSTVKAILGVKPSVLRFSITVSSFSRDQRGHVFGETRIARSKA
jgi:hypothetical protein